MRFRIRVGLTVAAVAVALSSTAEVRSCRGVDERDADALVRAALDSEGDASTVKKPPALAYVSSSDGIVAMSKTSAPTAASSSGTTKYASRSRR